MINSVVCGGSGRRYYRVRYYCVIIWKLSKSNEDDNRTSHETYPRSSAEMFSIIQWRALNCATSALSRRRAPTGRVRTRNAFCPGTFSENLRPRATKFFHLFFFYPNKNIYFLGPYSVNIMR